MWLRLVAVYCKVSIHVGDAHDHSIKLVLQQHLTAQPRPAVLIVLAMAKVHAGDENLRQWKPERRAGRPTPRNRRGGGGEAEEVVVEAAAAAVAVVRRRGRSANTAFRHHRPHGWASECGQDSSEQQRSCSGSSGPQSSTRSGRGHVSVKPGARSSISYSSSVGSSSDSNTSSSRMT